MCFYAAVATLVNEAADASWSAPSEECGQSDEEGLPASRRRPDRYGGLVNSADLSSPQDGGLAAREQSLYLLLDRVMTERDESADIYD